MRESMSPPLPAMDVDSKGLVALSVDPKCPGSHVHPLVEHADQLNPMWAWVQGLDYDDLDRILMFEDASWVATLRMLHALVADCKHEEGAFVLMTEPSPSPATSIHTANSDAPRSTSPHQSQDVGDRIMFQPWTALPTDESHTCMGRPVDGDFLAHCRDLVASVRLWDKHEYADAVWIKPSGNVATEALRRRLEQVLRHGYWWNVAATSHLQTKHDNQLGDATNRQPSDPAQMFTLAAFVAIRVIEHLLDAFHHRHHLPRPQSMAAAHGDEISLASSRHRLAQLWASTSIDSHRILLSRSTATCVQGVLNRRFVSDSHTEASVQVAVRHVLATLCEDDIAVHDAAYVAETLFTSTLRSCGTATDWVGRELGKALLQQLPSTASANLPLVSTVQEAKASPDMVAKTPGKKAKRKARKKLAIESDSKAPLCTTKAIQGDCGRDICEATPSEDFVGNNCAATPSEEFVDSSDASTTSTSGEDTACPLRHDESGASSTPSGQHAPDNTSPSSFGGGYMEATNSSLEWAEGRVSLWTLHHDILDMAASLQYIAARRRPWQLCVLSHVTACVHQVWPHATVHVYGSFATGLNGPQSDVDVVVEGVSLSEMCGRGASPVARLGHVLHGEAWVQAVHVVDNTLVPLLKVTTGAVPTSSPADPRRPPGAGAMHFDVSFNSPSHRGKETSVYVERLVHAMPEITPLVLVLKQLLQHHHVHEGKKHEDDMPPAESLMTAMLGYTGGLTSYALTLMVAALVQDYHKHRRWQHRELYHQTNLGELVMQFLHVFGEVFDPHHSYIQCCHSPMLVSKATRWTDIGLVVEDPLRQDVNAAKACFAFGRVQAALQWGHGTLQSALASESFSTWPHQSLLGCLFDTAHHDNVINVLQHHWCPDPHADDSCEDTTPKAWAADAMALLQHLGDAVCVVCGGYNGAHVPQCALHDLVTRFMDM